MKNFTMIFMLLAVLGFGVACDRNMDRGDDIQREEIGDDIGDKTQEMGDEIGHEADEMGDNLEDAGEEVVD